MCATEELAILYLFSLLFVVFFCFFFVFHFFLLSGGGGLWEVTGHRLKDAIESWDYIDDRKDNVIRSGASPSSESVATIEGLGRDISLDIIGNSFEIGEDILVYSQKNHTQTEKQINILDVPFINLS